MKRTTWFVIGGLLLLVLLGGAAYATGRLLWPNKPAATSRFRRAPELPQADPTLDGWLDHVADRSIFVGKGANDPIVEVVVNQDTKFYRNTTRYPDAPPSGPTVIQETVAAGSLDDFGEAENITVWGRRTGDRIVAEVLLYWPPVPVPDGSTPVKK